MQKYQVEMKSQNLFRLILNNIFNVLILSAKLSSEDSELKFLNFKLKL